MSLEKLVFILDGSFCFASVASTQRKTGTVVLLGKRPTAESKKSWTRAGEFFCKRTMVALRSPPETSISNDAITTNS